MKIIDLSITIENGMEIYKGDPLVNIVEHNKIEIDGYKTMSLNLGTHTGTHVDSFNHMHINKNSIDKIPLEKFFGESKVVSKNDKFEYNIGLFFKEKISTEYLQKILNANPKFVGGNISEELQNKLLLNNIITYTDLLNLDLLADNKFIFFGFPLKIKNGDGSPVRAIAITQ